MEHEGVRALLDRIFKKPAEKKASSSVTNVTDELIITMETQTKRSGDNQSQFSGFIDFKETLKQRMKARRLQARKEEAEEKQIDEEFHKVDESDTDEDADDSEPEISAKKKTENHIDSDGGSIQSIL